MRWLAILLVLLAPAVAAEQPAPGPLPPRPVVSEVVDLVDGLSISYVGTVSAKVQVDLGFPILGTIAERPVDQGDTVSAGEVLARLDAEDLQASVRAAEAGVAVASARAHSARSARDRARALAERGVGAQTRLDDTERALVAAEARLKQAEAALAQARDLLELATLKTPQDGIITKIYEEPGATLSAGQPVLQLSGTGAREIVIDLSEEDTAALRPGAEFNARLAADPEVSARARLSRIEPVAERNTRTRRVHLLLEDPPDSFRLGALVHVSPTVSAGGAIVLKLSSVLNPETEPAVWVVDRGTNTVHLTPVELGKRLGGYAVVASGIAAGDEIVTRGIHSLEDGQIVGPRLFK